MNEQWLQELENKYRDTPVEDVLLWPETPIHALQDQIKRAQGASDTETDDPISRPFQIISYLQWAIDHSALTSNFSLLDICCGDARVIQAIRQAFPDSSCYGVDMNKELSDNRAPVYRIPLQGLIDKYAPQRFDITMMLNTWRSWPSAKLRENELYVPGDTTKWLSCSSRYSILTVHITQIDLMRTIENIGVGERDSRLAWVTWKI